VGRHYTDLPVPQEYVDQLSTLGSEADATSAISLWEAEKEEQSHRIEQLRQQAQSLARAFDSWPTIRSDADWLAICDQAAEEYNNGKFLIERLGATRHLDPTLMAVLWQLRQQIIADLEVHAAHETMLIDVTVLAYNQLLSFNTMIGNLVLHLESEFFGRESPAAKFRREHQRDVAAGLHVEDTMLHLSQQLVPLMDRAHRLMTRSLRTLQDLRRTSAPSVAIGQMNVGGAQINHATGIPSPPATPLASPPTNAALTDEA
jgi:hypothetical protein